MEYLQLLATGPHQQIGTSGKMARFYAKIQGNRGEVTRVGSPKSGISEHIRGWDVGIKVTGEVDAAGNDVFHVSLGGTNGPWT